MTFVPERADLDELRAAARSCQACDLYKDATQTVFGEGPADAKTLVVGEQPGDIEDRQGAPFVGPAGKLLDRAFVDAGLDRTGLYVTNAVKHFKHRPAAPGKRRIHQTPDRTEIVACRPWLVAEFARIRPRAVVVLGATAGKALLGPAFRVTRSRGQLLPWPDSADHPPDFPPGELLLAPLQPAAGLRAEDRDEAFAGLVKDLRVLANALD
jgi:DNA polymerase